MKRFKKFIFNKITIAITLMLSLISVCFISTRTYAWTYSINGNGSVVSNNLNVSFKPGVYLNSNGSYVNRNDWNCSTDLIFIDNAYGFSISFPTDYINDSYLNSNSIGIICWDNNSNYINFIDWSDSRVHHYTTDSISVEFRDFGETYVEPLRNTRYITLSVSTNLITRFDLIMISKTVYPIPYEYPILFDARQYIFTLNEIERYYYYMEMIYCVGCVINNNGSFASVMPNSNYDDFDHYAYMSFVDIYRFLDDGEYYTFIYTGEGQAMVRVRLNGTDYYCNNRESFKWQDDMRNLSIHFENGSPNVAYYNLFIIKNSSLNDFITSYNSNVSDYNSLNTKYTNLQNSYNTLSNNYTNLQNSYNNYINGNNFTNLFFTIAETPFTAFKTIWNVDFLGVNLAGFVTGLLFVGLLIWVVKKIF